MALELKQAIELLRKESKKRKFAQTIDLIVNLKGIDLKRVNINAVIDIPNKVKDKKVCGFLTKKSELLPTVTKPEFEKYKEKGKLKSLVNEFDFFIAHASLMPSVATTFGKALGPTGKMPSPQLGIITQETSEAINPLLEKISKSVKIRVKEASVKVAAGKESMKDEEIMENVKSIYNGIVNILPKKRENVKEILLKFTMSKPVKIEIR